MNKLQYISIIFWFVLTNLLFGQLYNGVKHSMFSDIKANNVGDVITVLIIETADAKSESESSSSKQSDFSANGSTSGNLGKLTEFLPMFGASSSIANSHDGDAESSQSERLTGKISAIIVEQNENGILKIQGERTVEINGEKNLMQLEGLVRQRDIMTDNTVYSYNIANAKINYKKSGITNKLVKPGTLQKVGTWVIGVGLLAIAIMGISI